MEVESSASEPQEQASQDAEVSPQLPCTPKSHQSGADSGSERGGDDQVKEQQSKDEATEVESEPVNEVQPTEIEEVQSVWIAPEGFTAERMPSLFASGKGAKGGKGGAKIRVVGANTRGEWFFKQIKDKRIPKYIYYITEDYHTGQVGVITTTNNTCLDFHSATGCRRALCVKYHFELGWIVDGLPNAPSGPPRLIGPVPAHIKGNKSLQNQRFEWSKEEDAKIQYALIAQQKEAMEKLDKLRQTSTQQSQANKLAMRLAEAEESQRKFKIYQDEVMKGTVQPQWMYEQQQQMPQLGYQQMPQLGYLQMPQLGYQQSPTNNRQMHKRPEVMQWVKWPESKDDSMRSSLEQPTRQVHYTKSDSDSDSPDTKRALKEFRRERKDAKQARKAKSHRRESKRSRRSRTPDQDDLQDRKRRRNDSDTSKDKSD